MGGLRAMAFAAIINFFLPTIMAIDPNCDYYQDMVLGQQYYITSTNYPNSYPRSSSCRYMAVSPVGTNILLGCQLELPSTTQCIGDKLSISLSGNPNFNDARNFCGTGSITFVTDSNALVVGLFSTWNSIGGRFRCNITSIQTQPTTPKPVTCDCGWKQMNRIVGGHDTGINEYPLMAGIVDTSVDSASVLCGGSIISDRYVLTAGHCMYQRVLKNLLILVGDYDISTGTDTSASKVLGVESFVIHEQFNIVTLVNDVAVVRTKTQIEFNLYVGPVCLPFTNTNQLYTNSNVTALGWGQLEFSGPKSDVLQAVDLTVISTQTCAQQLTDNVITNGNICTFAEGKDACQSDSGGPLLFYQNDIRRLKLVGILSFGIACATDLPGVSTRVTSYLPWIVSKTSDATYCVK